jgi:transposase
MIPMPSEVRVWIATGHTDMRRGLQGLALQVQEQLKRDPHGGESSHCDKCSHQNRIVDCRVNASAG